MLLANGRCDPSMLIQRVLSHIRHKARRLEAWGYPYKAHQREATFFSLALVGFVQLAAPFYGDGGISGFGEVSSLIRQQYPWGEGKGLLISPNIDFLIISAAGEYFPIRAKSDRTHPVRMCVKCVY